MLFLVSIFETSQPRRLYSKLFVVGGLLREKERPCSGEEACGAAEAREAADREARAELQRVQDREARRAAREGPEAQRGAEGEAVEDRERRADAREAPQAQARAV